MHITATPQLTFDEIDDLLYFTRVNEVQDLQQTITELIQKYQCEAKDVLSAAIDPESGNTVLHFCSANGFTELLRSFLSQNVPSLVNHGNNEGNTPLHWAAYNGHLAIVKLLVENGADMWAKNKAGHLAMFEAERADKSEVVQYLLVAGGKEVEQGGTEGQPSEEDVADVQEGEASGSVQAGTGEDIEMGESSSKT
ncbi:uncharacterized protein MYCFIDRAFT_138563 [Pseudocercospora fijiensis CIRAD86]|uniref:Uncharacterized protein n=1 Tax=Pseudocercospora fijiensis (strain CIRAD86) TaxID=383855 RepID=M2YW12_PSEFD|nr:uncharacterized protein MYCFIDRAFT_138563 [Pseudocercospora fijiensis CIRAD86]EME81905.1 hypothetical protein MYCFIDRAFT_138563 [Pseudocercospora fijiensis CIRAD86]